jgi:chromatin structure-remodeling complex protein RSC7
LLTCPSRFNTTLTTARKQNLGGIYDPHTNLMQYPQIMQPTHARWERVSPPPAQITNGTNGTSHASEGHEDTIFAPVKPVYSRNYLIVDTIYKSPPSSNLGVPGPDGDNYDIGFQGLTGISEDILSELPPDCRAAFDEAKKLEQQWKGSWGVEAIDSLRRAPTIDKAAIT